VVEKESERRLWTLPKKDKSDQAVNLAPGTRKEDDLEEKKKVLV